MTTSQSGNLSKIPTSWDNSISKMKASQSAYDLIMKFEGLRLEPYRCSAGRLTIGYGHTKNVAKFDVITEDEAFKLLVEDVAVFEDALNDFLKVEIPQECFDALVSFVFNVGISNFRKSRLSVFLSEKKLVEASGEFCRWVYCDGRKLRGLERRRIAEKELFLLGLNKWTEARKN